MRTAATYLDRGAAAYTSGEFAAALGWADTALVVSPHWARAYCNRGLALMKLQRFEEALESFDNAIAHERDPVQLAFLYCCRGATQSELLQLDAALEDYKRALSIKAIPEFYLNSALVLKKLSRFPEALEHAERAIALAPAMAMAHCARGAVLHDLREWDAALACCRRAVALDPGCVDALVNLGSALETTGHLEEAKRQYDRALAIDPTHSFGRLMQALWLLRQGDFIRGFRAYQDRPAQRVFASVLKGKLWKGESLRGKTIVLCSEGGYGDAIQFVRYVRPVADLGARVILAGRPRLKSLLRDLDGVSDYHEYDPHYGIQGPLPGVDYFCSLMSLPFHLGTTLETVPRAQRYLHPDAKKVRAWRERLGEGSIGLVWRGDPKNSNKSRDLPLAQLLAHLPPGLPYVSVQKDPNPEDAAMLEAHGIPNYSEEQRDFSDAAALVECLGVLISTDTSTVHLAGAIGKRTLMPLNFNSEWRWLLERAESPWYPSLTLYRQERLGDWRKPLERIGAELRKQCDVN